jgi:hypothetical protein
MPINTTAINALRTSMVIPVLDGKMDWGSMWNFKITTSRAEVISMYQLTVITRNVARAKMEQAKINTG